MHCSCNWLARQILDKIISDCRCQSLSYNAFHCSFGINMIKSWWHPKYSKLEKLLLLVGGCYLNALTLSGQKQRGGKYRDCLFELMHWYLAAVEIPSYIWLWSTDFLNSIIHSKHSQFWQLSWSPSRSHYLFSSSYSFGCLLCCSYSRKRGKFWTFF